MTKSADKNFIHNIDAETGEETYLIQFDYGTRKIDVTDKTKITLDFVHGGFHEVFSRVGYDLIIGDNMFYVNMPRLGTGYGKEVWTVSKSDDGYSINIAKYSWAGHNYGYEDTPSAVQDITMTDKELEDFQSKYGVMVSEGSNTLYTTWAVLPETETVYHMKDCGDYAVANGKIILANYFRYGKESVFVGDELLTDIIKNSKYKGLFNGSKNKFYDITDSFEDETLYGGDGADKIRSYAGNDIIEAGKGNDKIYLGEGNKTIVLCQGDGKDTIYNFSKSNSVKFDIDTDNIYFTKSGKNLVLNRQYADKTEQTVISNYFKDYGKSNNIIVSNGDIEPVSDFTKGWIDGSICLRAVGKKVIKGTDYSDEAFSSGRNETFSLGKGNDIIRFRPDSEPYIYPYSFGKDTVNLVRGSHLTLDFEGVGGTFSYERKANDAVITSRHRIELVGRDSGKEEWKVSKSGKDSYTIVKTKYYFTGNGYKAYEGTTEETMTKSELKAFQSENGVKLKVGNNTLYTSWNVVSEPEIHYSMKDSANWGTVLGSVTLKNYFKYNEDSVYIGETSLQDYFKDEVYSIDKSKSKKAQIVKDTVCNEVITGSKKSDRIYSYYGNDTIKAGKGNDLIYVAEGEKVVNINKGDGKDTLYISKSNTSTNIVFDLVDSVSFVKDGNNLLLIRSYGNSSEETVIKDYFVKNLDNDITVSSPEFSQKLSEDVVGLSQAIICRYPPIDNPPVTYPDNLEKMPRVADEGHWELICGYPPIDDVKAVEPVYETEVICTYPPVDVVSVSQDVSAWQGVCDNCVDVADSVPTVDEAIVLVQGGI